MLNDSKVHITTNQEYLLEIFNSRLDFIEHIDNKINKLIEIMGIMKRRSLDLSRKILLTIKIKNYPSLMLNDGKVQFPTNEKHLV